ncbi:hypothetical protein D1007_01671 [Hordeum vulgare]|nr:hypothetical protein D1007_01671 [Hordeum vulgare]
MAHARRARAVRRATRVAQTAPVGAVDACRSPSPMANAATGPDAQEQQGSSQPATEQANDRTATPSLVRASRSASHVRPKMTHGRRPLAMATELLRYWSTLDRHNDWLQCIEELVAATDDTSAFSCSFRPQPSLANDEEQGAPPPPLRHGAHHEPRHEARPRDRPREPRAGPGDEASSHVVPRSRVDARALPVPQIPRRERTLLEADLVEHQDQAPPPA